VKVKFTLEQATKAQRGSRGMTNPVPIVQKAGWAPGPVWTGAENISLTGFDPRTVQPVVSLCKQHTERKTQLSKSPHPKCSALTEACVWL